MRYFALTFFLLLLSATSSFAVTLDTILDTIEYTDIVDCFVADGGDAGFNYGVTTEHSMFATANYYLFKIDSSGFPDYESIIEVVACSVFVQLGTTSTTKVNGRRCLTDWFEGVNDDAAPTGTDAGGATYDNSYDSAGTGADISWAGTDFDVANDCADTSYEGTFTQAGGFHILVSGFDSNSFAVDLQKFILGEYGAPYSWALYTNESITMSSTESSGKELYIIYAFTIPAPVLPDEWMRHCRLTIETDSIVGTLTNFPVLVTGDMLPDEIWKGYYAAQSDGDDIRFATTKLATTELAREVVHFDPSDSTAEIWVNIPSASSGTVFSMFWGQADCYVVKDTATYGKYATWNSDFTSVHHLEEDPGPGTTNDITNSASDAYHGTAASGMTSADLIDAKIGKGDTLDGGNDYIYYGDKTGWAADGDLTYSTWVYLAFGAANDQVIAAIEDGVNEDEENNAMLYLTVRDSTSGLKYVRYIHEYSSGSNELIYFSTANFAENTWTHITITRDVSTNDIVMYLNGAIDSTHTYTNDPTLGLNSSIKYYQGIRGDLGADFHGQIDETRFGESVRDSAWIAASHSTQATPSGFLIMGVAEYAHFDSTIHCRYSLFGSADRMRTNLRGPNPTPGGNFRVVFGVLPDRTGGEVVDSFGLVISMMEADTSLDYFIGVGDWIQGDGSDSAVNANQMAAFVAHMDTFQTLTNYWLTAGNHDQYGDTSDAIFEEQIGPRYGYEVMDDSIVAFYWVSNLDSNIATASIGYDFGTAQENWLLPKIKTEYEVPYKILFCHGAFWDENMFNDNINHTYHTAFKKQEIKAVFVGHYHKDFIQDYDGILYVYSGRAGGMLLDSSTYPQFTPNDSRYEQPAYQEHGYMRVTIEGDSLTCEYIYLGM